LVPLSHLTGDLPDAALEGDHAGAEVNVMPAQPAQLAASGTGDHR
jgi:hypothetical protein